MHQQIRVIFGFKRLIFLSFSVQAFSGLMLTGYEEKNKHRIDTINFRFVAHIFTATLFGGILLIRYKLFPAFNLNYILFNVNVTVADCSAYSTHPLRSN